jgi:hypothetical protein
MIKKRELTPSRPTPKAEPEKRDWFQDMAARHAQGQEVEDDPEPQISTAYTRDGTLVAVVGETPAGLRAKQITKEEYSQFGGERGLDRGVPQNLPAAPIRQNAVAVDPANRKPVTFDAGLARKSELATLPPTTARVDSRMG